LMNSLMSGIGSEMSSSWAGGALFFPFFFRETMRAAMVAQEPHFLSREPHYNVPVTTDPPVLPGCSWPARHPGRRGRTGASPPPRRAAAKDRPHLQVKTSLGTHLGADEGLAV
jgi:hypothetical protein